MKGIYCSRHIDEGQRDEWNLLGEAIVPRGVLLKLLPETKVEGEVKWSCNSAPEGCSDNCTSCMNIKIFSSNGEIKYSYTDDGISHQIGRFRWGWSGTGVNEHWFDSEAICLEKTSDYISGSGLTADSTRVVVFKRHTEVQSFRGDCKDETEKIFRLGIVWAEFKNYPQDYRANWTGFAMGVVGGDGRYASSGGWTSNLTPVVGDNLDSIVEMLLTEEVGEPTICKHNGNVRAHIVVSDPARLPLYLCKSCRMRGVRWEEFAGRNRRDTCPYFRRACKSVTDKSDSLPDWFQWSGNNLLSTYRRMTDGEHEAFEVAYLRRKEGFVRRSVLLLNNRTREAWMHRYNGFIPRTIAEFREKYAEGRRILGYMGTGYDSSFEGNFLTKEAIANAIANVDGKKITLIVGEEVRNLIPISMYHKDLSMFGVNKGEIYGFNLVPLSYDGIEIEVGESSLKTLPFYTDENGKEYYLISVGSLLSIRRDGQEYAKISGSWCLFG